MGLFAELTRNHVAGVHGILVLNEAEAVHEFDLSDLAGAMRLEMGLDIRFGGIAGEVPQIEAGGRYFSHICLAWRLGVSTVRRIRSGLETETYN